MYAAERWSADHTERIADAFYRQVTDGHLERAIGMDDATNQAAQKAAQNPA